MRRKSLILSMSCALLLLGGCSQEFQPTEEAANRKAIGFNAISGKSLETKAPSFTTGNIADFKVYAYETAGTGYLTNLNGAIVSKNSSGLWEYSPMADWPAGEVRFVAYSPASAVIAVAPVAGNATTVKSLTYSVPTVLADQIDFLAASTAQTWSAGNNKVTLNFRHALSRLKFQAKLMGGGSVEIIDIRLLNLKSQGRLDITTADTGSNVVWTAQTQERDNWDISAAACLPFTLNPTADYVNLISGDSAIMIMPQKTVYGTHKGNATQSDIIAAENGNAFYVLVSYVIPGTGGSGIVRNTLCAVANPTPPNQFTGFEFLAGKQYTFRLLLDSESNLIQIGTVTVTDMEDDTNVIDPINPQP